MSLLNRFVTLILRIYFYKNFIFKFFANYIQKRKKWRYTECLAVFRDIFRYPFHNFREHDNAKDVSAKSFFYFLSVMRNNNLHTSKCVKIKLKFHVFKDYRTQRLYTQFDVLSLFAPRKYYFQFYPSVQHDYILSSVSRIIAQSSDDKVRSRQMTRWSDSTKSTMNYAQAAGKE